MLNDNIPQKLWAFAKYIAPLEFQDQDVLNAVLEENIVYVSDSWNIINGSKSAFETNPCDVSIFHFAGINKPWVIGHKNYNYFFTC